MICFREALLRGKWYKYLHACTFPVNNLESLISSDIIAALLFYISEKLELWLFWEFSGKYFCAARQPLIILYIRACAAVGITLRVSPQTGALFLLLFSLFSEEIVHKCAHSNRLPEAPVKRNFYAGGTFEHKIKI